MSDYICLQKMKKGTLLIFNRLAITNKLNGRALRNFFSSLGLHFFDTPCSVKNM